MYSRQFWIQETRKKCSSCESKAGCVRQQREDYQYGIEAIIRSRILWRVWRRQRWITYLKRVNITETNRNPDYKGLSWVTWGKETKRTFKTYIWDSHTLYRVNQNIIRSFKKWSSTVIESQNNSSVAWALQFDSTHSFIRQRWKRTGSWAQPFDVQIRW